MRILFWFVPLCLELSSYHDGPGRSSGQLPRNRFASPSRPTIFRTGWEWTKFFKQKKDSAGKTIKPARLRNVISNFYYTCKKTTEVNRSSLFINSTIREGFFVFNILRVMLEKQKPGNTSATRTLLFLMNVFLTRTTHASVARSNDQAII